MTLLDRGKFTGTNSGSGQHSGGSSSGNRYGVVEMAHANGKSPLTFTDLFCGIGGFHVAAARLGMRCVFACDIDAEARRAYRQNFDMEPAGDITEIPPDSVPDHDVLLAGFPCQPFSIIGAMRGFADHRGTLFFNFVLENVRQLQSRNCAQRTVGYQCS